MEKKINNQTKYEVGVISVKEPAYPDNHPYNPSFKYPEYPFGNNISETPNYVYDGVRSLFYKLGYDLINWNTPKWNPLGFLIKHGETVVIKPNFVLSKHTENKDLFSIITHPSVIRAVIDYSMIALSGSGKIIVADAPQYNCNFEELMNATHLDKVAEFINSQKQSPFEIIDLRNYWSKGRHFPSERTKLEGDPKKSELINMGQKSCLVNHKNLKSLYGAMYDRQETIRNHSNGQHNYEVSGTIINADVLISLPKLKVHKKVGVTLNLKGLVGICINKNLITHYTLGTPSEGGDQFPENLLTKKEGMIIKFERWMYDHFLSKNTIRHELVHRFIYGLLYLKIFRHFGLSIPKEKRLFDAGNWYGNDTAWRMVCDLARIIYYTKNKKSARKTFSIIDGIVGGENNGPLHPDPKHSGILIGGQNFLAVDLVATRLMGLNPLKLKQFTETIDSSPSIGPNRLKDIKIVSNKPDMENCLIDASNTFFSFKPHPGWLGHIEI